MSNLDIVIVVTGGFTGGLFNTAFAGGGLIAFLALAYAGVPPLTANAVNLLVMPSSFLAVLRRVRLKRADLALLAVAAAGTVTGALLVTRVSSQQFSGWAPWLVMGAALLLVAQPTLTKMLRRSMDGRAERRGASPWISTFLLACAGVYAGFFGAGVGTVVLVVLAFTSGLPFTAANRAKNVVCLTTSVFGCVVFLATGLARPGLIDWPVAGWLAVGMTAGGVVGTWLASHISEVVARWAIVVVSAAGALRLAPAV